MPCNGVAVVLAQIANVDAENQRILSEIDEKTLDLLLVKFMGKVGYELEKSGSFWSARAVNAGALAELQIARGDTFKFQINNGRVIVRGGPDGMQDKIASFLNLVAGKRRQAQVVDKLKKIGVKVNKTKSASNGAVVLSVEV